MLIRDMTIRQLWQCIGGLDRDMPVYVLGAGPGGGAELLPVRAVLLMPVTDARRVDLVRPTPRGVTPCVVLDVRDVEAAPWRPRRGRDRSRCRRRRRRRMQTDNRRGVSDMAKKKAAKGKKMGPKKAC